MNDEKLTRRQVLGYGAVTSITLALGGLETPLTAAAAADPLSPDLHVGTLTTLTGRRSATVDVRGAGPMQVSLEPSAFVQHAAGNAVSDLSLFVPGEEVVFQGRRTGTSIRAGAFQSVYRAIQGEVTADDGGETLRTSVGDLRVPRAVRARAHPTRFSPGDRFGATIWTNPTNGDRVVCLLTNG